MSFAMSHTTYAKWHGIIFNFEWKWDLDYFLAHAEGSKRIRAVEAYASDQDIVKVEASCRCGGLRAQRVRNHHDDRKHAV